MKKLKKFKCDDPRPKLGAGDTLEYLEYLSKGRQFYALRLGGSCFEEIYIHDPFADQWYRQNFTDCKGEEVRIGYFKSWDERRSK